ncbi:hypothetical protein SPRG_12047 [Saprolegnia parasitica CBS 223.65]|uniref:SAP domain-containing protein n=1 Tax=Saprolegnia parasitica (strain CBS 223.65) TaxID=695850 RepID=A0A067BYX4_SAPPC|nr:hypothetical protein SPRG_12047 [Saprolegnia parasitica CBS 223.65]KDO22060.1 hypothetical protein SPRG_12047 [Saprolegnia parasitica CBS 223.65]|eukprot:XP_012207204.1 hypothetical protein SPRG_12047 [Saprolegnia parasitica CBS 223.65]
MPIFGRKKVDIRVPTGKNAVNLRKLLFLTLPESSHILPGDAWDKIDFRCLSLMKVKMLRAACLARELEPKGGKRLLVERLTSSLERQRVEEDEARRDVAVKEERRINKLGGIWTCGTGTQGQLGHGDCENYDIPTQIKSTRGMHFSQVYAGFDSDITFGVTRAGDVYVWGNKSGPTGLPRPKKQKAPTATPAASTTNENVATADEVDDDDDDDEDDDDDDDDDANDDADAATDEDDDDAGVVLRPDVIPAPVKLKSLSGEDVVAIAVGRVHCAARTKNGDVFTWGQNDHCQLGHEAEHSLNQAQSRRAIIKYGLDAVEPVIWTRTVPETCVIVGIAVGTDHTLAVSDDGDILGFGSMYNSSDHSTLSRHLRKQRVTQICCGALHAAIVNANGQMYTWGSGDGGRLGHGDLAMQVTPRLVDALASDIVLHIACGCWHTVAIVLVPPLLKGGFVYTWGTGRYGQLAQGGQQMVSTPGLVRDFLMQSVFMKRICAGMYHNVALSIDDEVYTWGSNVNGCLGRPLEMATNPETFSAVPGVVEGMSDFIGRPCAIACGREYTVIATKPYLGPSEEEVEAAKAAAAERQAAIQKQIDREEAKAAAAQEQADTAERRRLIQYLNVHHPLCPACTVPGTCAGFQRDDVDPILCRNCLHSKVSHTLLYNERDKAVDLDGLRRVAALLDLALPDDDEAAETDENA